MTPSQKPIEEKIKARITEISDVVVANSWMQLYSLITHINRVTEQVLPDTVRTQSSETVLYLINSFKHFAFYFYERFSDLVVSEVEASKHPYTLHRGVSRLCNYWESISPMLHAVRDPRVRVLETLVREAQPSKLLQMRWSKRIEDYLNYKNRIQFKTAVTDWVKETENKAVGLITLPYYSRRFELVRFEYAPYVYLTGVPLYDLETPWTWQVVWHEMAGHVADQLERGDQNGIPQINQIVKEVETAIQALEDKLRPQSLAKWLETSLAGESTRFARADDSEPPDFVISKTGWMAEFLEDAYSVLSLGPTMLTTLRRVLHQHYENADSLGDERHPSLRLRLLMAAALLREMGYTQEDLAIADFGTDDWEECEKLQVVAKAIKRILAGEEGYVPRLYERPRGDQAQKVRDALLGQSASRDDISVSALVTGAHLAFEKTPQQAVQITQKSWKVITGIAERMRSDQQISTFTLPPEDYFKLLLVDKSWEELIGEEYQRADYVSPGNHTANQHPVWITFTAHGVGHSLWHTTAQHG
jgi:hypothetical protein